MNKAIKLRKCPFCGKEAYLYKVNVFLLSAYKVSCSSCEASMPPVTTGLYISGHFLNDKEAAQKAADKWNDPCNTHKNLNK